MKNDEVIVIDLAEHAKAKKNPPNGAKYKFLIKTLKPLFVRMQLRGFEPLPKKTGLELETSMAIIFLPFTPNVCFAMIVLR